MSEVPEGEEEEGRAEKILEEIWMKIYQICQRMNKHRGARSQGDLKQDKDKETQPRHIKVNILKTKGKRKSLERSKRRNMYRRKAIRRPWRPEERGARFQMLKGKNSQLRDLYSAITFLTGREIRTLSDKGEARDLLPAGLP